MLPLPSRPHDREWALQWLCRGPNAYKAAGITWDELMAAGKVEPLKMAGDGSPGTGFDAFAPDRRDPRRPYAHPSHLTH